MDESIKVEKEKCAQQKPPRSLGRIACEILAGTATGLAVALPVALVIGASAPKGCFAGLAALVYMFFVVPLVYGLGSAVGVYLVGSRGIQTGSFLATLGWGFLTGFFSLLILYISLRLQAVLTTAQSSSLMIVGFVVELQKIVRWVHWAIVLLIPPIVTTFGFNLTRRYKEPVLPRNSGGKYFVSYR